jgi:predicted  nucleic acid-binding Zn-ribbon protein
MTAARNAISEDVVELRVKVEKVEERDKEARENIGKLFSRIDDLRDDVSGIRLTISEGFGKLRGELAVQDERYKTISRRVAGKAGAKWAAIVSSIIGFLAVVVDNWLK